MYQDSNIASEKKKTRDLKAQLRQIKDENRKLKVKKPKKQEMVPDYN